MKKVTLNNQYEESKQPIGVTETVMGVTLALLLVFLFGVLSL